MIRKSNVFRWLLGAYIGTLARNHVLLHIGGFIYFLGLSFEKFFVLRKKELIFPNNGGVFIFLH